MKTPSSEPSPFFNTLLDESSVRFRNVAAPDGRPALQVTARGPDGPEQVLDALFEAARLDESAWLADLCPRGGDIDGDVRTLCELHPEHDAWREFTEAFAAGAVTGPAEIDGDRARVPFRFGPAGERTEVMELIRVDGRWGLASF